MMNRVFDDWLNSFRESISDYEYYVDFKKIYKNVDEIKIELNILNSLIGSKNIQKDFLNLVNKYPEILKCIPILIAVRTNDIFILDNHKEFNFSFNKMNYSPLEYLTFMQKIGLFELMETRKISNLYDYVLGIEVGLDSNARKNRGGHLMENLVENFIIQAGFQINKDYFKEMYASDIELKWNIDLSLLSNNGLIDKRFDYFIKTNKQIYLIETNFYSSGGSKLNEIARSYKQMASEINQIKKVTFVWFTDGKGWKSSRRGLQEAFESIKNIYNINDLKNGIIKNSLK
ncbi:restriction endonuclease [Mycoplasma miroungirhinis]|uniref:Type-2 restriction enzyme n=2 Tax=Mycoplasma miroungirhinis TaxID=754516 RepID=A0A6M4JJ04_9MOLU|nr:restriction endonuclease [Mycoplasma miroungirhinis]